MSFNIWEGIYRDFSECPTEGDGFEGETWVSRSVEKIKKLLAEAGENRPVPSVVSCQGSLLPFLAAVLLDKTKKERIGILDFGGGLGSTYVSVISGCTERQRIDYNIVESRKMCKEGALIFKDEGGIRFHSNLPPKTQPMDIVHLGSSIHYIEDWGSLIKELAEYEPSYFLFEDLPAGDIPTYATVQNYYGSKIPCWFFNINDIVNKMSSVKFKLLFKSTYSGTYLGSQQEVRQNNFPVNYRIGNTCNLLFARDNI